MSERPAVAVIGAGVTGLRAARALRDHGLDVTVFEASTRMGGQIRTVDVGGVPVDVGAEAMHLGAPGAAEFIESLGLTDTMITARPGASWLATPRGLRRLPAGVGPAGPTKLRPVLQSGIMSVPGLVRAGLEPALARRNGGLDLSPGHDVSVAEFVGGRFGGQVVDRFVDPLLGSLHAGDVRRLSLRACAPSLAPAAREGRSLIAKRKPGKAPVMSFVTWRDGLISVIDALADGLDVRTGRPVSAISRHEGRYRLALGSAAESVEAVDVDGLVLATSSAVAGDLLRDLAPTAERQFARTERASVATVVLAYPRHVVEALPAFTGTGVLVPSSQGRLLKAATHLSTKWPHLQHPDLYFVRVSAGRAGDERLAGLDDDALLRHLRSDLADLIGLHVEPRHTHVERWVEAMPQLTVGHPDRLAEARADLPAGLAVAGSSYDGVGIAACLGSARRAADTVAATLGDRGGSA